MSEPLPRRRDDAGIVAKLGGDAIEVASRNSDEGGNLNRHAGGLGNAAGITQFWIGQVGAEGREQTFNFLELQPFHE